MHTLVCVCVMVIEDLCVMFGEKTIIVGAGSRTASNESLERPQTTERTNGWI